MESAVGKGLLSEEGVDAAINRTLFLRFELGLFDSDDDYHPLWHVGKTEINSDENQQFVMEATKQSIVLLRNDDDGDNVLPFKKGQAVAVIGPHIYASSALLGYYLGQSCPGQYLDTSCITSVFHAIQELNALGQTQMAQG